MRIHNGRERVSLLGFANAGQRRVEFAAREMQPGFPMLDADVAGGQASGLLKRPLRGRPVPVVKNEGIREGCVRLTEAAVERDSLLGRRLRFRKRFPRRALVVIAEQVVAIR